VKTIEDVLDAYVAGDDSTRAALRKLFASNAAFHWAKGEPPPRTTAEGFRQHLLLISLIDHGKDFRDTLLYLNDVHQEAKAAGVDLMPALREVAELSSDEAHTAMGSLKSLLLGMSGAKR
jgi:hypothetical protein